MLKSISWTPILISLGVLLVLYYLWWYWTYVAKRRTGSKDATPTNIPKKRWRMEEPQEQPTRHGPVADVRPDHFNFSEQDEEIQDKQEDNPTSESQFKALQGLAGDVTIILQDSGLESDQEELLIRLRREIQRYPALQHKPAFRHAINRVIKDGALTFCGQTFSDEQLSALWEEEPQQ